MPGHAPGERVALATALAGPPIACRWPPPERLERLTRTVARAELAGAGLDVAAFEAPLVREALRSAPGRARHRLAPGARELLAVEAAGEAVVEVAGGRTAHPLRRRPVELAAGAVLLTDYKTAGP